MAHPSVSMQTIGRLPLFLNYLRALPKSSPRHISAKTIADALGLNDVQVRKDLAAVSNSGRPKIGYITQNLIFDLEQYLGCDDTNSAVVAGAGNLGRALLSYGGFAQYGLNIVAAFDVDPRVVGLSISEKPVLPAEKLEGLCRRMNIRLGIVAVPENAAQNVCDALVRGGVLAVWNFAPAHLRVPKHVLVHNENMASSLAVLSNHLTRQLCQ